MATQEEEKKEWQAEMDAQKEDRTKSGEEFVEEEKEWLKLEAQPFETQERKFVICIDTLGQDRELTNAQKRFALETAHKFKETWEKFENEKLTIDRNNRIKTQNDDKEWITENLEKLQEEENKFVDEKLGEYDEFDDDDQKNLLGDKQHLIFQALLFKERDEFITRLADLKQTKIFKDGKFMQSLFYLLGYEKEAISEAGTQKFDWKKAKVLITDEFIEKMENYEFMGPKENEFKSYQTLNYIQKNIEGIQLKQVEDINMSAGRLFKWLELAI